MYANMLGGFLCMLSHTKRRHPYLPQERCYSPVLGCAESLRSSLTTVGQWLPAIDDCQFPAPTAQIFHLTTLHHLLPVQQGVVERCHVVLRCWHVVLVAVEKRTASNKSNSVISVHHFDNKATQMRQTQTREHL